MVANDKEAISKEDKIKISIYLILWMFLGLLMALIGGGAIGHTIEPVIGYILPFWMALSVLVGLIMLATYHWFFPFFDRFLLPPEERQTILGRQPDESSTSETEGE